MGIFILVCGALPLHAYVQRDLLQQTLTLEQLKKCIVINQKWVPFPSYEDREGWNRFLGNRKAECITRGEKCLDYNWRIVRATDYLEFDRSGNRRIMEEPYNQNMETITDLLLAELAEGRGRFVDQLINGIYFTCELSTWSLSAHLFRQSTKRSLPEPGEETIDLAAGDVGSLLSWVYYFFHTTFDRVNPAISKRLKQELERRIQTPYLQEDYWWMALDYHGQLVNNWNPWCNSNVLLTFMLMEDSQERLAHAVYRSMMSVDKFLNYIHADGACEEGSTYWGHASGKLLDYLELLSMVTADKVDIFKNPLIRNMGEYISRSYVGDGWVVNFADASARLSVSPYVVYRYGKAVGSDELLGFAGLLKKYTISPFGGRDFYRILSALLVEKDLVAQYPSQQLCPFTWYPDTEVCFITSEKTKTFFAAKGGHNDESHNHNDIGTFSYWINDLPVIIDVGVGTYTRQTFSDERYSIWTMQCDYHNLPLINNIPQQYGRRYKATQVKADNNSKTFSVELATAYPESAQVKSWIRKYQFFEDSLLVTDLFSLKEEKDTNVINFMVNGNTDVSIPGKILIRQENQITEIAYNENDFSPEIETIKLTDPRLSSVWGKEIYRLSLKAKKKVRQGTYSYVIRAL